MKKSTFLAVSLTAMLFLFFAQVGWGQLLLDENFSYTTGTALTANGWTQTGTTATNPILVSAAGLSYTGYLSSGIGLAADMMTTGQDLNQTITTQTSGTVYASFLVNVTSSQTTGDYFFHLIESPITGNVFKGRVFVKKDPSSTNFAFGVSKSSSTVSYTGFTYTPGTTYLVVLKYAFSSTTTTDDNITLYINPPLGSAEPASPTLTYSDNTQTDALNIGLIGLRQGSATNAPALTIDGIRVGLTWADITPSSVSAPTVQASNLTFSSVIGSGMTANWTNGDGGNRVVIINTSNSFTTPVDGTDPVANTTYGGSGEQVVYNGSSNTVSVTGLTPSTTYWFRVYEYNGIGTGTKFLASTATNNPMSQATTVATTAPLVTTPTATSITHNSAVLGGNITSDGGTPITERGTVWKTSAGVTISDNKLAEGGTATGVFSHTRSSLPAKTNIFYKAYAMNLAGTTLSTEASFYTLANEPTTHVTGFTATAASTTGIDLSWTAAATGADGYLILQKSGAVAPTGTPADATAYVVGATIGDGTVAAVVTPGSTLTKSITGLSAATQYSFTIIPFASDGVNAQTYNYYTAPSIPSASAATLTPPASTYTWNAASGNWGTAANWTPARTTPAANDILIFDGSVQAAPSVVLDFTSPAGIGKLQIMNNAAVNFATSDAARTLNIGAAGGTTPQLDIQSGSSLTVSAVNALTMFVATGYTGVIAGNLTFTGAAHKLNAADAGGVVFANGSMLTQGVGCTGNIFTNTGTSGAVSFASGSVFVMKGAGSNPFALSSPLSKVVFQTGSLYRHKSANSPSFSGRIYANFEMDTLGIILTATGGTATSVDNMTITNGTLNFNMTGTTGHSIKGNILVAAGATLNFAPATAGTVFLNGTSAQTISGAGNLTFGTLSTIAVNNASGITLNMPVALNNLTLTNGLVTTGANLLTVNGTITGASATSYVNGKLAQPFSVAASKAFPIGKGGNYRPLTLNYSAIDAPSTVTAEQTESALSGTMPSGTTLFPARFWTVSQTGASVFTYDITLDGTGFTPAGTAVILKNDAGTVTSHTTAGTPPAYTSTGLTSFSDFGLGDYVPPPTLASAPSTLSGFSYILGSGPSTAQSFTVSGVNLTGNISIAAPAHYEISTTVGSGYTTPITLTPTAGTVANTTIYVRLKAGLSAGAYNSEVINITSPGAVANTVTCNGSVINPTLVTGSLADFGNVCINTTAGPSTFTITGTDLTSADVTVGALSGFTYSTTAGGTYTASLSLTQPGGAFSATIYVKFTPTAVQSYNGNIPVSGGGAPSVNCAASGSGVNTPATVTTTTPATSITGTTATCSGNVTDAGCGAITARGICYGTSLNPDISGTKVTVAGTTGAFSGNLTSLVPSTIYHYRAYVTTSVSTTYGADYTFTTLNVAPTVVTNTATSVTGTSATLNGSVNANNSSTIVTFEYGLTAAYGSSITAVQSPVTGVSATAVSAALNSLIPNTTYHFRAVGVNAGGTTNGNDLTFTTPAVAPTVTTNAATSITGTGAMLNGTVNANNATTAVTFEFGTTTSYGSTVTATQSPVNGTANTAVSFAISGLTPNTLYHFRAVGVNSGGTTNGSDLTFTTSLVAPVVVTNAASAITQTTATLNGTVTANNSASTVTFEYGLTTSYGSVIAATPSTVTGMTPTAVLANITGLLLNTTYHYRCVAVNAGGTTNGNDQTFLTGCPSVGAAGTITGPAAVCANSAGKVYTVGAITNATGYAWTVPAGAVITAGANTTSITVTFGASSGNVSVYGTGTCGNGTPSNLPVNVNALPAPTITGPASACQTSTGNIYSTQAGMTGYNWTVSAGGQITAGAGTNSITVSWTGGGAQSVSVNYANGSGCTATAATVYPVTVTGFQTPTITGANNVCESSDYFTYTTEPGMTNYQWNMTPGSGTITWVTGSNQVTIFWNSPGAKWVSVNYTNPGGCTAQTATVYNVTVNPLPAAAGTITGSATVCPGASSVAYSVAAVPGATSYAWTVPSGATIATGASTNSITVNYSPTATSGNITVSAMNSCGSGAASPAYAVTVSQLPAAAGAISGPNSVCQGTNGVVYSVGAIANATSYSWSVPTGATITAGATTSSITVNFGGSAASGMVTVNGVNSCGNGTTSSTGVAVNPKPATPVITQTGNTLSSSAAAGNQWYLNGSIIPGATAQTYEAVYNGDYSVVVTLNGCSSDLSNVITMIITGIDGSVNVQKVDIYPNPNHGKFTLTITSGTREKFDLRIVNNLGIQVFEKTGIAVDGSMNETIQLPNLPLGVYSVVLNASDRQIVRKIVIN